MKNDSPVRVLVVDEEPIMRAAVAESLQQLGDRYAVDLASSGNEALSKLGNSAYSLLMTDYEMGDLDGLRLARLVRRQWPDTRIVLMASMGSEEVRGTALREGLDGYVDVPFTMTQIQTAVKSALRGPAVGPPAGPAPSASSHKTTAPAAATFTEASYLEPDPAIGQLLERLLRLTRARCTMLLRSDGVAVQSAGHTTGLHMPSLGALIAGAFAATVELSRQLGNDSVFRASHHDGPDCNIYTVEVDEDYLLAVVFGGESLPGAVWLFARQTASKLALLTAQQETEFSFGDGLASEIDSELDDLFTESGV